MHIEFSLWRCWIFKLTFFPFNNYCNTNPWSENVVKKPVLGEHSSGSSQSWCSEIRKEPSMGARECIGDARTGTRPALVTAQRIQWESNSLIGAELQPRAQLQGPEHRISFLRGSYAQARKIFALCLKHYHLYIAVSSTVQLTALSHHSWSLDMDWERRSLWLIQIRDRTRKDKDFHKKKASHYAITTMVNNMMDRN